MISTLVHKRPQANKEFRETKQGYFMFTGAPIDFHEWEFRTMARWHGTKADDRSVLASKIIEGLRDDAFLVAKELGYEP